MFATFDVEIRRTVVANQTRWLEKGEAQEEGLSCNRAYTDMRGYKWKSVSPFIKHERDFLLKLEPDPSSEEVQDEIEDAEERICLSEPWPGVDLGVNAVIAALSAARCVPFTSCNGGCCGDRHQEIYPLVAFYTLPPWISLLIECATESDIGIENGDDGCVVAYADDIWKMLDFAQALLTRKSQFNALRVRSSPEKTTIQPNTDQLDLFD